MNIKQAKQEILNTLKAYLAKDIPVAIREQSGVLCFHSR